VIDIDERRGGGTFLALFLAGAFGLAAWRGASGAPVLAAFMGVLAVTALVVWLRWISKPRRTLHVSPDLISFGRPGEDHVELRRFDGAELEIWQALNEQGSWFLGIAGQPEPAILLMGFAHPQVAEACLAQGWTFRPRA
jgi:hypothetical protein